MNGSNIVVLINLIGDSKKNEYEEFRLSLESDPPDWNYVTLDTSKPFHTQYATFSGLLENQVYKIVAQFKLKNEWNYIKTMSVPSSKYLIATSVNTIESKTLLDVHPLINEQTSNLNITLPLSPVKASLPNSTSGGGDGGGGEGGGDIDIPAEYILPQLPTQQTQNIYDTQGYYINQAGSCVANAIASAKEVQESRQNKSFLQYSVSWFFGRNGISDSEGMNYYNAYNALKSQGIPPATAVPRLNNKEYYPDTELFNDSKKIYQQIGELNEFSRPQKIHSYKAIIADSTENITTVEEICNAIKNIGRGKENSSVVTLSITIDKSFDDAYGNGIVGNIQDSWRGGHSLLVVGWTTINSKKYWITQNSWTSWYYGIHMSQSRPEGDNGLFYIPFDWYIIKNGYIWGLSQFFILEDDASAPPLPSALLNIDNITPNSARWTIHNLGNNFNSKNYVRAGVTSSKFTSASNGNTTINDVVGSTNAPTNGTATSASGTINRLYPNKNYTVWGFAQASNKKYYATSPENGISFTTLTAEIPALWSWENPKQKDKAFNLTATEWINFCKRINAVRFAYGYPHYSFTTDSMNIGYEKPFTASLFLEGAKAIREIQDNVGGVSPDCLNVVTGGSIYAWYFTNLEAALNNTIRSL